jgi:hypothetical protein
MSVFSEQEPTNPQDPLHYAPRRRGERTGVHLRSVASSVGETKFDRPFRVDPASSPFASSASLDAELEDAIGQTLRRHLEPQVMPEPAAFVRERSRRNKWLTGGGVVIAVGVAAVVALLLVTVMPVWRDHGAGSGLAAAVEFALPHGGDAAKSGSSQARSALVSNEANQAVTHEQSQQLLDRFIQWRQKTDAAQHQQ